MYSLYFLLRSLADPVFIILIAMGIALWVLRDLRKEKGRRLGWWMIFTSFCLLYLLSIPMTVYQAGYLMEKDYPPPDPSELRKVKVVVVLGGGVREGILRGDAEPIPETASRLLYSLQLLREVNADYIVFSGGYKEAKVMARIAKRMGVDESRIVIEPSSRDTWQQAVELNKLLLRRDITIGLVTSAIHMRRSLKVFKRYFPNIVPIPSGYLSARVRSYAPFIRSLLPCSYGLYMSMTMVHELLGLLWYDIRLRFLDTL